MKGYKSATGRLARLFKESREKWKKRAKEKQKKARALETKVRDLSKSRESWKEKAKQAERELGHLKAEQKSRFDSEEIDQGSEAVSGQVLGGHLASESLQRAEGHHYPVYVIQLAIEQVIHSLTSLRGSQKTFALWNQFFRVPTPSFSSIRHWLLRVGLYELQQKPVYGTDWIVMLDLTIELGQLKCLVILGLPASRMAETGFALGHQDVEVLRVAVIARSSGEVIEQELVELTERIGQPLQIVSDHGSDVKKGITLYQQGHPEVIWTYDVTHQMAKLLEKELADDERYQSFLRHCTRTRQQTKQTALYFLAPPKQRLKARYLNVETHLHWAQQVLHYQAQGDFSTINPHFSFDKVALTALQSQLDPATLADLTPLSGQSYPDQQSFCRHLSHYLGPDRWAEYEPALCQAADLGRRHFTEKLGWLSHYQADLPTYVHMMDLVERVERQLKHHGLSQGSKDLFDQQTTSLPLSPRLQQFRTHILTYLDTQAKPIPEDQTLLATSDVLESLFGKYKLFSAERSFQEIGQMVLTIPLFTTKLTPQRIIHALQTVRLSDVQNWTRQVFGQSMLAKRRALLKPSNTTLKLQDFPP